MIVPAPAWTLYTPARRRGLLAILFLVSMCNYTDRQVMSVLLEPIKREFGASDAQMGLLTGFAFAACYAVLGLPVARWSDRGDRPLVIAVSLLVWSVATAAGGFARSFTMLALTRTAVGIGEAGAIPPAQSLIADYFAPAQRTRALAIFIASSTAGYLIAFVGGARIAAAYGWRTAFIALGLPGLLLAVLTWAGLAEPRRRSDPHAATPPDEPLTVTLAALFRKRSFVLLNLAIVLYFLVAYGALTWIPAFLIRVMHLPLAQIGAKYGAVTATAALVGTLAGGFLTDALARRDVRWLAWTPGAILVLAAPAYEWGLFAPNPAGFYLAAFVGGTAVSAAVPAMFSLLQEICGPARRAMAVAVVFFFANLLGLGFGPLLTGALSDRFTAFDGPAGLRSALLIAFAVLVPSGLILFFVAPFIARDRED